eukprot:CAMPEP_0119553896 /NCGR_PEP_ID=MMETSP1352-20130426/6521_1 /TAXON_ID=265584 /ORGANISM="Stauroneis constricta, Strain CCMP1120" /LENGTH=861 /DNA_ID=CAMNT_0007600379 /DNA_START=51 /DNA_END=2636 /DNA_ORIENTATION=-
MAAVFDGNTMATTTFGNAAAEDVDAQRHEHPALNDRDGGAAAQIDDDVEEPLTKHNRPGLDTYFEERMPAAAAAAAGAMHQHCNASIPSGCTTITSVSNWPTSATQATHSTAQHDATGNSSGNKCRVDNTPLTMAMMASMNGSSSSFGVDDLLSYPSSVNDESHCLTASPTSTTTPVFPYAGILPGEDADSHYQRRGKPRAPGKSKRAGDRKSKGRQEAEQRQQQQEPQQNNRRRSSSRNRRSSRRRSMTSSSSNAANSSSGNGNILKPPKAHSSSSKTLTHPDTMSLEQFLETQKLAEQYIAGSQGRRSNITNTTGSNTRNSHSSASGSINAAKTKRRSRSKKRMSSASSNASSLGSLSLSSADNYNGNSNRADAASQSSLDAEVQYNQYYPPLPLGYDNQSVATYPDEVESLPSIGATTINSSAVDHNNGNNYLAGNRSVASQDSCSSRKLHRSRVRRSNKASRSPPRPRRASGATTGTVTTTDTNTTHNNKERLSSSHTKSSSKKKLTSSLSPKPGRRFVFPKSQSERFLTNLLTDDVHQRAPTPKSNHSGSVTAKSSNHGKDGTHSTISNKNGNTGNGKDRKSDGPRRSSYDRSSSSRSLAAFMDYEQNHNSCPLFDHDDDQASATTIDVTNAPTIDSKGNPGIYTGTCIRLPSSTSPKHHSSSSNDEPTQVPHGYGRMNYTKTSKNAVSAYYHGQWINGIRSGHGKSCNANGDIYIGTYWDDMEHGVGTIRFYDGRIVSNGTFENGLLLRGTMNYEDGSRYQGNFLDGKRHGSNGLYKFEDGSYYKGDFCNDQMHGHGELVWNQFTRYVGEWKCNQRHGRGVMEFTTNDHDDNDNVIIKRQESIWKDGKKIKDILH